MAERVGYVRREHLSVGEARRLALSAQGFGVSRVGAPGASEVLSTVERIGMLQLDSVSAVCRSHYLPLFSRLGPYPRALLDDMAWGAGRHELFEFWGHAASLLPVRWHPLVQWRMDAARRWSWHGWSPSAATWDRAIQAPWAVIEGMLRLSADHPTLLDEVADLVARCGPVAARSAHPDGLAPRVKDPGTGAMWNWHDAKIALEWLFCTGRVTTATRRGFERIYDLTERVLPPDVLSAAAPDEGEARRELLRIAASALGVATRKQLLNYFRMTDPESKARLDDLVRSGELLPVQLEGVSQRMYMWARAVVPDRVDARCLLSPFDSLIWDRDRAEALFDFHYRIGIYARPDQRDQGYYVMPFLLGDSLVARVDLRADRKRSTLVVGPATAEPGAHVAHVAGELAAELSRMAEWLELGSVEVTAGDALGRTLKRALTSRG